MADEDDVCRRKSGKYNSRGDKNILVLSPSKKVNDFLFFSRKGSRSRYKYHFCIGFLYGGE